MVLRDITGVFMPQVDVETLTMASDVFSVIGPLITFVTIAFGGAVSLHDRNDLNRKWFRATVLFASLTAIMTLIFTATVRLVSITHISIITYLIAAIAGFGALTAYAITFGVALSSDLSGGATVSWVAGVIGSGMLTVIAYFHGG
jgi:hypothetical protein